MPIDKELLGKRLRQARVANGFSQADMAIKMGFGRDGYPIVSRMESGRRKVTADELHRWALYCGTTSDGIIAGKPLIIEAAS